MNGSILKSLRPASRTRTLVDGSALSRLASAELRIGVVAEADRGVQKALEKHHERSSGYGYGARRHLLTGALEPTNEPYAPIS